MSEKLQLISSYDVFNDGTPQGTYDFRIETDSTTGGSKEALIVGGTETTKSLPRGLHDEMTMTREQAFEAIRHMQDKDQALSEAFGANLDVRPTGVQIQGVLSIVRPNWVDVAACDCTGGSTQSNSSSASAAPQPQSVEKIAFVLKDGWLTVSSKDRNGVWHSDSEKVEDALSGLTFTQIAEVISKIVTTVEISWWMWALLGACAAVSGGTAAVLCALALIALELITIAMIIAIVEEVTGQAQTIASLDNAENAYASQDFGGTRTHLVAVRSDVNAILENPVSFPYDGMGSFIAGHLPPVTT